MLKVCLLPFPTERRLLQLIVQHAENGDLEIGDHPCEQSCSREKQPST